MRRCEQQRGRIGLRYIIVWNNAATNFGQFLSHRAAVSIPRYGACYRTRSRGGGHANREEQSIFYVRLRTSELAESFKNKWGT